MAKKNIFLRFRYIEKRIQLVLTYCIVALIFNSVMVFLFQECHLHYLSGFMLSILLLIPVPFYIYFRIYVPYKRFVHLLQLFNSGYTYSHFTDLNNPFSKEFEKMDERLSTILTGNASITASKRQAEYLALQNQINPHFLYNTLEGIRAEALISGNTSISSMCEALSRFYRYTISHIQNLVPFSMELSNTKNYFFIQKYRFGERISLKLLFLDDCEEQALRIRIPKLTLQPIVENAIVHGLECKSGLGVITIIVEVLDSRLLISVKDNGVGIEESNLEKLRKILSFRDGNQTNNDDVEGGIALKNVNQRIKILFGEQYGIEITSCLSVGTDVSLNLPLVYENIKEDNE